MRGPVETSTHPDRVDAFLSDLPIGGPIQREQREFVAPLFDDGIQSRQFSVRGRHRGFEQGRAADQPLRLDDVDGRSGGATGGDVGTCPNADEGDQTEHQGYATHGSMI